MQVLSGDGFADLATWMVGHLDRDLLGGSPGQRASLSPRHFSRRFTAVFGCAPARYVEDLRMSEARRMLARTA